MWLLLYIIISFLITIIILTCHIIAKSLCIDLIIDLFVFLEPIYEEVAKDLQKYENVRIVKMDGTANEIDVPGIETTGYPSLFFFAAGSKSDPIPYQGAREKSDLIEFITSYATSIAGKAVGNDEL
jgi:hypothetical protein